MTMPDLIVPIETCYRRPYVPKRCTVERVEYPLMKEYGSVSQIERADATVAFRLHNPIPALSEDERTVDLLTWHGRIWWPHWETVICRTGVVCCRSVDDWQSSIENDRDLCRILPPDATAVAAESFSRNDLPDGRDETTAEVKRGFAENFLVCDDMVYAAGGVPVLALWQHGRDRRISIVATGKNRQIVRHGKPLAPVVGFFATAPTERAFVAGRVCLPGQKVPASPRRIAVPEIEVMAPDLVVPNLIDHNRIDSIFRACERNLDWLIWRSVAPGNDDTVKHNLLTAEKSRFGKEVRAAFVGALEPDADDRSTSRKRLAALGMLFAAKRDIPRKHLREVRMLEAGFAEMSARYPAEVLAPEDEDAFARLGV